MFGRKKKKKAPEPNLAVPDGAMKTKAAPSAQRGSNKKTSKPRRPPKLALKGGDGEKSSWKQRISISSLLLSAVLTCILTGGIVAGGYALTIVYENKLSDTWAILFLELESYGNRLTQKMNQFEDGDSRSLRKDPSIVLKVIEGGARFQRIQGDTKVFSTPADFHLQSAKLKSKWTVLQFAGNEYLTAVTSSNTAMKLLNQQLAPAP